MLTILLTACLAAPPALTDAEKQATADYLATLAGPDGGYSRQAGQPTSLRALRGVNKCLTLLGKSLPDPEKSKKFADSCRVEGGFADRPGGKPDVTSTAVGVMAAVELGMPAGDELRFVDERAKEFEEVRIGAGAFEAAGKLPGRMKEWEAVVRDQAELRKRIRLTKGGMVRMIGGETAALLRLKLDLMDKAGATDMLRTGQANDGGFNTGPDDAPSDLETTYRVMRALHMLGAEAAKPDELVAFIAKCRNADGGYGTKVGEASSASGAYYALTVLKWLGRL